MSDGGPHARLEAFARTAGGKLATGLGEPEDQLRGPLEILFTSIGDALGAPCRLAGESRLAEERIRPDFAAVVGTNPLPVGFIEVKAPGVGVDTRRYRGRNKVQWERLSALPNLVYTDGNSWALFRQGELVREARLKGDVRQSDLRDDAGDLEPLIQDFLLWEPASPRNASQLVSTVAGLCRLLRDEVLELTSESKSLAALAADWRDLLFPEASDAEFADGYAQAVTFALLLARAEGIDFAGQSIHEIARALGKQHSLMGKALDVLTDEDLMGGLYTSVNTLLRVCSVVDWAKLSKRGEPWLRFYEHFLAEYDPELRKRTGSYYTPNEVVQAMVRLVDGLLRDRLAQREGFLSPGVVTVDPAMGTGTFLLHVIRRIGEEVEAQEGPGAVGPKLGEMIARLIGFERQLGPYAVAELRAFEEYRERQVEIPADGLRLYVADTLDNPNVEETRLGAGYEPIARSRRAANKVKRDERVMVVIGNPPYRDKAGGLGGWIEHGDPGANEKALFDDFIPPKDWGVGRYVKTAYNFYAYFWRWALWKAFEAHDDSPNGVVAFITSAGFISGPGFAAMRRHMRAIADELWVIDVTPEGHRPDVATRLFPGVQQPLAITFVLRNGTTDRNTPARVNYLAVSGRRQDKFAALDSLGFTDKAWQECGAGWADPFKPRSSASWETYPLIGDLFPLSQQGIAANRTWPISPDPDALKERWRTLVGAPAEEKAELLKETPSTNLTTRNKPLPGLEQSTEPIGTESGPPPEPVRLGFRSFDVQWILPDSRVIHRPRPDLWRLRVPGQLFLTEQNTEPLEGGPGVTFTAHIPDMHHYNGRGGRVLPLWRSADRHGNVLPGLLDLLGQRYDANVSATDLMCYVAAVVAHPGYTSTFRDDLAVPGVRLPLTSDPALFEEAVQLGGSVIWAFTLGDWKPRGSKLPRRPELEQGKRPLVTETIPATEADMPNSVSYDPAQQTLRVGSGAIGPVPPAVWNYEVSTYRVVQRWVQRRLREPEGKRSSPLDEIRPTKWTSKTTTALLELLNAVGYAVELEPSQAELLERVLKTSMISEQDLAETGLLPVAATARKLDKVHRQGGLF